MNREGELMLSAGSKSGRGILPWQTNQNRSGLGTEHGLRVEGLVSCHRPHPPSGGGYLIRGRKVGGNWGVGGVRLGT